MSFTGQKIHAIKPKPGVRINPLHSLSRGLVGWWLFNEMAGDVVYDVSVKANDGTFSGMTSIDAWRGSPLGASIEFDAVDNLINVGSDSSLNNLFLGGGTITAWINPRTNGEGGNFARIAQKNNDGSSDIEGWVFFLDNGRLRTIIDFDTGSVERLSGVSTITLNQWQHVALVWDGSITGTNLIYYINGKEPPYGTSSNASGSQVSDAAYDLIIGNRSDAARTFDGQLDDVRIFDRELSSDEIHEIYINPYAGLLPQFRRYSDQLPPRRFFITS